MALAALLTWIGIGSAVGALFVTIWKTHDLTLAWGIIVGGAGGSAGGLIGRMLLPESVPAAPIFGAIVGAVVAMLIGRAEQRRSTQS